MDSRRPGDAREGPSATASATTKAAPPPPIPCATADFEERPHELFRQLRPITPLVRREDGGYIAIRACDVERLISDPRTRQSETELPKSRGVTDGPLFAFFKGSMLFTNGPDHRRRRAPLSRAFAVKLIASLRPRIREVADQLIDGVYARREMNLLDDYAALIPARVLAGMLGIPETDIPRFTRWVYCMARAITPSFAREDVPEIVDAANQLTVYARELLADRRATPRDDFLTSYVQLAEGNLSAEEILAQIVTVILAGSDTTRAAMTIQVGLLLQHREQWEAVCKDAALVPGAVAESLRYEPSVGSIPRFTLEDIDLDGHVVPRNRMLSLSTLSAMRDPAVYTDPDRFDILRSDQSRKHMVFGGGTHRCLGEALAKAELEEGLAALTARLPQLRIAGEPPTVRGYGGIRRVSNLHVTW
jgi:cytochrome P450 family 103